MWAQILLDVATLCIVEQQKKSFTWRRLVPSKWTYKTISNMDTGPRKYTSVSLPLNTYKMVAELAEANQRSLAGQITYSVQPDYDELVGGDANLKHMGFPDQESRDAFERAMDREERKDLK